MTGHARAVSVITHFAKASHFGRGIHLGYESYVPRINSTQGRS